MKVWKTIIISVACIVIAFGTFKITKSEIENMNSRHVPEKPAVEDKKQTKEDVVNPADADKMMFHSVYGVKETTLPVKCEKNHVVYEGKLYVTQNKGKTWMQVPNDDYLGYAGIKDYVDDVSPSSIYVSSKKIAVAYGGRGSENISIMDTDDQGKCWGVVGISKTATHDLKKGYDKICIDFLEGEKTGYVVAVRDKGTAQEKINAWRSVDSGASWNPVDKKEKLYQEIMKRFGF